MFAAYEAAIVDHLAGVVPGAIVHGTFDEPDLEREAIYVHVVWQGYTVTDQSMSRSAAALAQRFAVTVGVGAARISTAQAIAAANALGDLFRSLLGFSYVTPTGARIKPQIEQPPPPAYAGAAAELAVYFTLAGVASAQPQE